MKVEELFLDVEYAKIMSDATGTPFVAINHKTANKLLKLLSELMGDEYERKTSGEKSGETD